MYQQELTESMFFLHSIVYIKIFFKHSSLVVSQKFDIL